MAEQYKTTTAVPSSTLGSGITSGSSSLTIQSGDTGNFPSDGVFRIRIDNEIIIVGTGGVSGSTFSVLTRGAEGTTAASHSGSAPIYLVQTAGSILALGSRFSQRGAHASRPGTPDLGTIYADTDGLSDAYYDGAAYRERGPIYPLTAPPIVGGTWTWGTNQGSASVTQVGSGITMLCPANAGGTNSAPRIYYKNIPQAAPWSVAARFDNPVLTNGNAFTFASAFGLVLLESGTNKMLTFSINFGLWTYTGQENSTPFAQSNTNIQTLMAQIDQWSSQTTHGGATAQLIGTIVPWMRVRDGGAGDGNIHCAMSPDGQNWSDVLTIARGTPFTSAADKVGVFTINNFASGILPVAVTLTSWLEGT